MRQEPRWYRAQPTDINMTFTVDQAGHWIKVPNLTHYNGYPVFQGRYILRQLWEEEFGPPRGQIRQSRDCPLRSCVNPYHARDTGAAL